MKSSAPRFCRLLSACAALLAAVTAHAERADIEAPRVTAALEQGLVVELGIGLKANPRQALRLYCDAATMGSAEAYVRMGRILARGPSDLRNAALANAYFALAAQLGHHGAAEYFDEGVATAPLEDDCSTIAPGAVADPFDLDGYLAGLPPAKRNIAGLIRLHAARYGVDVRIALAIALAESNLDAQAVSPRNAQGVMQLIPGTQERFGVTAPFDPESNIKGGLAYLKWLKARFAGNWELVAAAYNAGEGAVERHRGIPPYRETQGYVRRVQLFAGVALRSRM